MNKLIYSQQNMIMFFLFLLVALQGCKKEEETTTTTTNTNKTIVKYEIISPVATLIDSVLINSLVKPFISYTGPTFNLNTEFYKNSFIVWTKEVDVTNTPRPFYAVLGARCYVPITTGTATMNIYVNGVLKVNVNLPIKRLEDTLGMFMSDELTAPKFTID
jgi:hypothetical protein